MDVMDMFRKKFEDYRRLIDEQDEFQEGDR